MIFGGENIGAVVADVGSHFTRIGFAGEDSPRAFHQTVIGTWKQQDGKLGKTTSIPLTRPPLDIDLHLPVSNGLVDDFDLYQTIWEEDTQNILKTELRGTPVLLAEKSYATPKQRHKLAELFFETFQTSSLFFSKDSVLSCYACGKTTGLAVDLSASGSTVCPVIDGYAEARSIQRSALGTRTLDAFMLQLLVRKSANAPHPSLAPRIQPLYVLNKIVQTGGAFSPEILVAEHAHYNNISPRYRGYMRLELGREVRESVSGKFPELPLLDASPASQSNSPLLPLPLAPVYLSMPSVPYE
eukprot:gene41698-50891_t